MKKNKEFAETIAKAEEVIGGICLYTVAFTFVGFISALIR